jgi:hypothetical protein
MFALAIAAPALVIAIAIASLHGSFENRQAGSILFLAAGAMSLLVFFQEMYAFYATNSRRLLWMSAAFFVLGIGMVAASAVASPGTAAQLQQPAGDAGGDDPYVTRPELFRMTSEFAAAIFILLGTLRVDRSINGSMEFKAYILVATIMVAAVSVIVYLAAIQDRLTITMYSGQYGWSLFSLYTEMNVLLFFAVISAVYFGIRRKSENRRNSILFWFIIGFLLLTSSEIAFTAERLAAEGGPSGSLVWAGRAFLVAAFATFVFGLSRAR